MPQIMTDLYRMGNASSPRMEKIRVGKDIDVFEVDGVLWVAAGSGGVSTFSHQHPGKNWWKLPRGATYSNRLYVGNDHRDHFSWEPSADMPLSEYVALLLEMNLQFAKVE